MGAQRRVFGQELMRCTFGRPLRRILLPSASLLARLMVSLLGYSSCRPCADPSPPPQLESPSSSQT